MGENSELCVLNNLKIEWMALQMRDLVVKELHELI